MPEFLDMQLHRGTGMFAHLTGLLFTHLHHDHFDRGRLEHLLRLRPELPVYGPGLRYGPAMVRPIRQGENSVRMGKSYILAKDTVHDGARYRHDPHQSYLIRIHSECFFVAGDGILPPAEGKNLAEFYGQPVTAGFFNLYQLATDQGKEFLRSLAPERVFLYHLPFAEDDRYHYHQLARQVVRAWPADLPRLEVLAHMAWLDNQAADWEKSEKGAGYHDLSGIAQHGSVF